MTAGVTFLARSIGWATDSVSKSNLNGIDRLIVDRITKSLIRSGFVRNAASYTHFGLRNLRVKALEDLCYL